MSKRPIVSGENEEPKPFIVTDTHHAPVIYFDGVPNFGNNSGIVNLTLVVAKQRLNGPTIDVEVSVATYLKCNLVAARELRDSLDKAILMATPPAEGAMN